MQVTISSLVLRSDFFVAYACGLVILVLFCIERFNQPTNTQGSFVEALVPKAVSNGFQYIQTFVIYVAIMLIVYTGLSIVGPHVLPVLGLSDSTAGIDNVKELADNAEAALESAPIVVPAWVPLSVLLILTGGATHFRALNQVEFFARRLTHRLIGIPQNVESLAGNIRDRRINLEQLSAPERDSLIAFYNLTVEEEADSLQQVKEAISHNDVLRRALRLFFLHYLMEAKDLPDGFGSIIKKDYSHVWKSINKSIAALRSEPQNLRLLSVNAALLDEAGQKQRRYLIERIDQTLNDLHALIAVGLCPVYKNPGKVKQITDALSLAEGGVEDNVLLNRVLLALIALFFGVLTLVYLTQGDPLKAFQWATGAFVLHGAAAISAWRYYQPRVLNGNWVSLRFSKMQIPTLQYIYVALRGYVFGTLALALWHGFNTLITTGQFPKFEGQLIWIPAYGAVGVMTAFWVAYDFDVVHENGSPPLPRRVLQVVLQAATTAGIAFFITVALLSTFGMDLEQGRPIAMHIALTTLVASGILGFIAVFLTRGAETSAAVTDHSMSGASST